MWHKAAEPIREHVIFRPYLPSNPDILFSGTVYVPDKSFNKPEEAEGGETAKTEEQESVQDELRHRSLVPPPLGSPELDPQVQHLACFQGGLFALAGRLFSSPSDFDLGRRLTMGCVYAYDMTPTGISPESFTVFPCSSYSKLSDDPSNPSSHDDCNFSLESYQKLLDSHHHLCNHKTSLDSTPPSTKLDCSHSYFENTLHLPRGIPKVNDARYILRPEAIESVFIMWRLTGDPIWRDHGWRMFEAIRTWTRTTYGHSAIDSVLVQPKTKIRIDVDRSGKVSSSSNDEGEYRTENVVLKDEMESFWLAETLKYFWLLFEDPEVLSLDEYVLNTEAHPLRLLEGRRAYL